MSAAIPWLRRDTRMDVCGYCAAPRFAHEHLRRARGRWDSVSATIDGVPICDDFKFVGRRRYYLYGVGMWAVIITVAVLLGWQIPPLRVSVISLVAALFGVGHYNDPAGASLGGWPFYAFVVLMAVVLASGDRIYSLARREEEQYRRGSENWTLGRRASSCIRFGLAHFWNLVIPLAAVLALILAGWYLMVIYLRSYRKTLNPEIATATATHAHVAYNRVVLTIIGLSFGIQGLAVVLR